MCSSGSSKCSSGRSSKLSDFAQCSAEASKPYRRYTPAKRADRQQQQQQQQRAAAAAAAGQEEMSCMLCICMEGHVYA
jgi:hypothetical protein